MRKGIILGIGILIILLALAGTGSAKTAYGVSCAYCHPGGAPPALTAEGMNYKYNHAFDGTAIPSVVTGCLECHSDLTSFLPLTSNGSFYNETHRYNATTLAANISAAPGCANCHGNVSADNFTIKTGTPTYTNSSLCKTCHEKKYNDWYSTMHRVMLTTNTSGAVMNLTVPDGKNWTTTNVSYMIVGKTSFYYLNETGQFFSKYYTANSTFASYSGSYSCGGCHTTNYSATGNQSGLSGIVGTWTEEGITCENCHGPGGNGHQVTINKTGGDCNKCHYGDSRQGQALTNKHATGPAEESMSRSCTQCHSPYDRYMTGYAASLETAANVTCFVCHNPHGTTDDKYAALLSPGGFNNTTYAEVGDVKLGFFNATASNVSRFNNGSTFTGTNASLTAGNDIYDNLSLINLLYTGNSPKTYGTSLKDGGYGNGSIDLTGRPDSEKLCSLCHYRHGIAHIREVNLTHGRNDASDAEWATCTDCHNSGSKADHSFDAYNATNYPKSTCSKGTNCHVTSSENVTLSNLSIVPIETEWNASLHNEKENGVYYTSNYYNNSSCNKCHSPTNWDPANESGLVAQKDFKGITCAVCHDIHNMGGSINSSGLKYSWYNRDASYSSSSNRYSANYTLMANTTELCGNCHSNVKIDGQGPGWNGTNSNPTSPHGWPAKDIFVGSWKQSGMLKYECIDCHMYINKTNATGYQLVDANKTTGHSFAVDATGLQNTSKCNVCHENGTAIDTIQVVVNKIQADTIAKHTTVNATVTAALENYKSYGGIKTLSASKIAQAYWNVNLVKSDESWGVHDPIGTNQLLDDALVLAAASNSSLGMAVTSNVDLITGWNLVSLNGTPADTTPSSVMNSVKTNITVVWTYNATGAVWELYDPLMPSALNTLKSMVQGKGYWIYATQGCKWTV
ncbi:MAG: hypothetical protein C3F06_03805 [Candidatus Methanoperedenaceae archaeon]|nr:MAG: hypothetical protein C3F06_03805 [Candidatus Methanoperedenaceae archaeon]